MTNTHLPPAVDYCDWLKTAAIMLVAVDHIGYFFIDDAAWWSVFGRMAAPVFFFLMGYARSRTIPPKWIWLGIFLTLLDSWNNDWDWMPLNILFSLALIRFVRPYIVSLLRHFGWVAFVLIIAILLALLPIAGEAFDYGAEGWLWALFGLCQRMRAEGDSANDLVTSTRAQGAFARLVVPNWNIMRMLICPVAATIYIWQEQLDFRFSDDQLIAVTLGVSVLSMCLFIFVRGPSRLQPPEPFARILRFLGRHTLEIYVIQLAGSEIIINVFPDLAA
jgi:hypothetical protein